MNGVVTTDLIFMQVQEEELMQEEIWTIDRYSVFAFRTGEKVEILKTVDMPSGESGKGYIILNKKNESVTVDAGCIRLLDSTISSQ